MRNVKKKVHYRLHGLHICLPDGSTENTLVYVSRLKNVTKAKTLLGVESTEHPKLYNDCQIQLR